MVILIILALVVAGVFVFLQQPQFGRKPTGERKERISKSPNFRDGKFQNQSVTPDLVEGVSYVRLMKEFFFDKSARNTPTDSIPNTYTGLKTLSPDENVLIWFGHSSYFIQIDGKKFLVDPVFSGAASPVRLTTPSFKGSDAYSVGDIPSLDHLIISHDHWDHLDYKTVTQIKDRVRTVVTGLGTGEHLEYWGYNPSLITELDWNEAIDLGDGFSIKAAPARHFSGRGLIRNQALWVSFILTTPKHKIYIGGDSGYDKHFKTIGDEEGPFDLVILECGQYNEYWRYIHMLPEETAQAAVDLKAKHLLPVHWSKFSLALHDWDEPITKVIEEATRLNLPVVHPMIGEKLDFDSLRESKKWWLSK